MNRHRQGECKAESKVDKTNTRHMNSVENYVVITKIMIIISECLNFGGEGAVVGCVGQAHPNKQ